MIYFKIILIENLDNFKINQEILLKIKTLLKPNGELIVAINNKYGISYFAGKNYNDYNIFATIENDVLFSKNEIESLLKKSGYENLYFYYPIPNYVLANEIYSDDFLPKYKELNNVNLTIEKDRYVLFNEDKALNEAINTGDFSTFANSYLIRCK